MLFRCGCAAVVTRDSDGAVIEWLGLIEPVVRTGRMPIGTPLDGGPDWKLWETKDNYKNILAHTLATLFSWPTSTTRIVTVNNAGLLLLGCATAEDIRQIPS